MQQQRAGSSRREKSGSGGVELQGLGTSHRLPLPRDVSGISTRSGPPGGPPVLKQRSSRRIALPKPFKEHKYFNWIIAASFILTFNAGFINSLTLNVANGGASAHVTGMVAKFSGAIASEKWDTAMFNAISWLCFIFGATVSGMLIQHETFYLGRNYGKAFLLIATVQSFALALELYFEGRNFFVYMCCVGCGLQNALTSKYSGNVVRTTHLTGTTTDLGIAIGHTIKGRRDEGWRIFMHSVSVCGFFFGGAMGYIAFQTHEHLALLVNISLTLFCGIVHTCYIAYHENLKVLTVIAAKNDIKMHKYPVPRESSRVRENSIRRIRAYTFDHDRRTGQLQGDSARYNLRAFSDQDRTALRGARGGVGRSQSAALTHHQILGTAPTTSGPLALRRAISDQPPLSAEGIVPQPQPQPQQHKRGASRTKLAPNSSSGSLFDVPVAHHGSSMDSLPLGSPVASHGTASSLDLHPVLDVELPQPVPE